MDYCYEFSYLEYMINDSYNNIILEASINEAKLIAEGNNLIDNITPINEGVADKVKAMIAKIVGAIGRIWGKFLESMNHLVTRDKDYLAKYKKIILEKTPLQDYKYKMYKYYPDGQKRVINTPIPAFNYQSLEKDLESQDTFIKKHFPNMVLNFSEDYKITEKAKTYFRGSEDELEINQSSLNMADLYNYCLEYPNIKNKIISDTKNIKTAANEVLNKVKTMKEYCVSPEIDLVNGVDIFSEGTYLSYLYENTILHEKVGLPENKPDESKPIEKTTTNPNDAYKSTSGEENKEVDKAKVEANGGVDEAVKRIQLYIKISGEILSAKLTVVEEIYKDYMTIIRFHVKDHVGVKNDDTDKPKDKASTQGTVSNGDNDKAAKDAINSI